MSSLRRSRRRVSLNGINISFAPHGWNVELRENGVCVALRSAGSWDIYDSSAKAVLSACFFEWAVIIFFL
ncbi:hypothetical protein, partial [Streptomyces albidoflavus]|uniref:hypothetical protein n=1 Tax=Streptomyces albidoflavus TaxID=1886 RepID=UPI00332AF064